MRKRCSPNYIRKTVITKQHSVITSNSFNSATASPRVKWTRRPFKKNSKMNIQRRKQQQNSVSGDFYWAQPSGNKFLLGACDCTGHGVPGAFMSLLNISFLNESVIGKKIIRPDLILNQQRDSIIKSLNPTGTEESKDGM